MAFLKKNDNEIYEKALGWFWVILFISAVLYLRWLLVDMHAETARLSEERERFRSEVRDIQKESTKFYEEFRASIDEALKNIR
jgi:hypothetical protein